jgi:V-type H+-transporting ATPase subunit G
MPPKSDYVQRLLQAEENRNRVIADARQRKNMQLKQAKVDAEKAVQEFKNEKDREVAQHRATLDAGAAGERMSLVNEAEREIEKINRISGQRMSSVVALMVDMVTTVSRE